MMKRISTLAAASVMATMAALTSPASAQVTFEWATVGDPGNAEDPLNSPGGPCEISPPVCISGGIGSVGYVYRIAKHEVTTTQYAEFLNAVAATDTNGLYNPSMGSDPRGGIAQSGVSGSFSYNVKPNMDNKPVNYVSFFDAMRFVNWLHNGQPTGLQNASTTEDGVYTISSGLSETRAGDALFFIPTQNEWYKAAYHDARAQGEGGPPGDDHFWFYPTKSDSPPTMATANATGDISNPGTNVANWYLGADWNGQDGNVTTVGSAGPESESFHGTSDQGGNVFEWNETVLFSSSRGVRGGSWLNFGGDPRSSNHFDNGAPGLENNFIGFRVASPASDIPTVSQWGLAAMVLLILTAGTILHGKRVSRPA